MWRLLVIGWAALTMIAHAGRARWSHRARRTLPGYLRRRLERLGPPFVKLGQALSLRRDLLPDDVTAELQHLQDAAEPFPGAAARAEVERSLGKPIEKAFSAFEETPFAAASIAQVHRARLLDGREVIIKVRRPGIRAAIDRDMHLLVSVLRAVGLLVPAIKEYDVPGLAREIWARMQIETDLRREALNVRRFAEGMSQQPQAWIPQVVEPLCSEWVLVQEFSHGRRIDDPALASEGPRLGQALVELYLHQFFVMGVFHGDPHPGNLFVMDDGRICFHDFGVVGELSLPMRRHLAVFMEALAEQDEDWLVDAAVDLGLLGPAVDRRLARQSASAVFAQYASRPLSDWSLGDVLIRFMRAGRGAGAALPLQLAILARAALLIEQVLRGLDRNITVVGALGHADPQLLRQLFSPRPDRKGLLRLESEAAAAAQRLPAMAAAWLHRAQREGGHLPVLLRIERLESLSGRIERGTDRLALALVALGLYIAASLLMQHSIGPRVSGAPVLGVLGYGLALWLTLRVVRGIAVDERRAQERRD